MRDLNIRKGKLFLYSGVISSVLAMTVTDVIANHGLVSLAGSNFEIDTDANLVVDHPLPADPTSLDWTEVDAGVQSDEPDKKNDDSFGQGSKEDTEVPSPVTGSIPPNKSDLKTFGVYLEETPAGDFFHLFWHRVQDPSGTTNMDFELNQSGVISANGVTPVRTSGDVLIQYDLANGGTVPELFVSRWMTGLEAGVIPCEASNSYPCWGERENLTDAGDATGSINTSEIPDIGGATTVSGVNLGSIDPRTFGEATLDFAALIPSGTEDQCTTFGSAYLKSRSSDSFTAALKDYIAPLDLSISNCGGIRILKNGDATDLGYSIDGAIFSLHAKTTALGDNSDSPDNAVPAFDWEGHVAGLGADDFYCEISDGECQINNVFEGNYYVCEASVPPGYQVPANRCAVVTIGVDEVVEVTFNNLLQRGAIDITKTRKHAAAGIGADDPHEGVAFTIYAADDLTVASGSTNSEGKLCIDNLVPGDYTVVETVPTSYSADGSSSQDVTVTPGGDCEDNLSDAASADFRNIPLTDVSVSVSPQIAGATVSSIVCTDGTTTLGEVSEIVGTGEVPTMADNGNISLDIDDLEPMTVTCTIVIDP